MSVLIGIWHTDNRPADKNILNAMSRSGAQFGPDCEEAYLSGWIGMIFRGFHTAKAGYKFQPYVSQSGNVVMWDGRLDNREELLHLLGTNINDEQSEAAIVSACFEAWGTNCFAKLLGEWALTIWIAGRQELILCRDFIGTRHLFYFRKANQVAWCTLLSPLVALQKQHKISEDYVAGYLAFNPDSHLTPYEDIKAVPPGSFVIQRNRSTSVVSYWSFRRHQDLRYRNDKQYEDHFRELFRVAVRRRMQTDRPLLADLSGGLDSSSIVCMADQILRAGECPAPRLDTFSYYDSNEPDQDDLDHIGIVERKRGQEGYRFDLRGSGDSLTFDFPDFTATPGFGQRAELTEEMREFHENHSYNVVLSGLGGDEMNGQPLAPQLLIADDFARFRFLKAAKKLSAWSLLGRRPWIQLFFQSIAYLLPLELRIHCMRQSQIEPWINSHFAKRNRLRARQLEALEGATFYNPAERDSAQTIATLARYLTSRRPSCVERWYPFLDRELVEFLTSIPLEQLLRPGQRRSLMRRSLSGILPAEILARKTKACSARCYAVTLEKHWDTVSDAFRSSLSGPFGFIEEQPILMALEAMKGGQMTMDYVRLLKALSLEFWLRDAQARGIIAPPPGAGRKFLGNPRTQVLETPG